MSNINTVTISGNLTRDPELKRVRDDFAIAKLGIAVNRSKKVDDGYEEVASFFEVDVLGKYGELVARKLQKGDLVTINGRLEQQRWETDAGEKRSKVSILALDVDGQGMFRSKDEETAPAEAGESLAAAAAPAQSTLPADDDIPF